MNILFILGSLRANSASARLAEAIRVALPDGHQTQVIDGRDLPLYDTDLDVHEKPLAVQRLLDQVAGSEALIFVTPEYNYGIPGPLKNLIDWASRPAFKSPLKGKPSWVLAQSISPSGGARVHAQLTAVLSGTLTPTFLAPSFTVSAIHEKFDSEGILTDSLTQLRIDGTLPAFLAWADKQSSRSPSVK